MLQNVLALLSAVVEAIHLKGLLAAHCPLLGSAGLNSRTQFIGCGPFYLYYNAWPMAEYPVTSEFSFKLIPIVQYP